MIERFLRRRRVRTSRVAAVAFGIAALTLPAAGVAQRDPLSGFDRYVDQALARWDVPGVAVVIVRGDSIALIKGYGKRQAGRPEPVTTETLFEIGSTSKAFSSALLAMLVDDGALSWDDPVTRHLPWFELWDPWVTREVTLRDLLSHRVGVTGLHNGLLTASREEIVRRTRHIEPNIPFRSAYDYSNMMYATAGLVAEAAAGKRWEDLLAERLLEPLGMRSTTIDISRFFDSTAFTHCFYCPLPKRPVSIDDARRGADVAMPHLVIDGTLTTIPWQSYDNAASAGSVISNARDLAQWLRLLLGEGTHEGRALIRAETFREMHRPQSIIRPAGWIALVDSLSPSTHFWNYGLGWRMNDYRGRKVVWHTGGIVGFLAMVGLVPEERLGFAVLSNGEIDKMLPQSLAYRIIDAHLGAPVRDWTTELHAATRAGGMLAGAGEVALEARRAKDTRPSLPLERMAGTYRSPIYGDVTVSLEDGTLRFRIPNGAEGVLRHWHYDVFRLTLDATWTGGLFATFSISPAGGVSEMAIQAMGSFARIGSQASPSPSGTIRHGP
ncbi:MAG: serine hydrolase [Gemmatimonadales bacterium]